MPLVEIRYAEALLKFSIENKNFGTILKEFNLLMDIYSNNYEIQSYLINPEIKIGDKKDFVTKIFKQYICQPLLNFLKVLIDKKRISYLPAIYKEYLYQADKYYNIITIEIFSAFELDSVQIKKIESKFKELYKAAKVKSIIKIDQSLIGGLKVIIGNKVYDASIKYQLEKLKSVITHSA